MNVLGWYTTGWYENVAAHSDSGHRRYEIVDVGGWYLSIWDQGVKVLPHLAISPFPDRSSAQRYAEAYERNAR